MRTGEGSAQYQITLTSPLAGHDAIKGNNFKMCTNAFFFEKKSELSELHYIFNLLEAKTL